MRYTHKKLRAFSLIEISIALVIIGLLVGAVLKGQDLLTSARLKTIMTQIQNYRLATHTFMDRYGALPGDFHKASSQIHASLKDGNNDGVIQGNGLSAESNGHGHEALSFWSHLAAAELISDIKPGAEGLHAIPSTKMGGHVTVAHNPLPDLQGHWFIIGAAHGSKIDGALFTPQDALAIAKKMDTDDPHSGTVQIRNGAQATGEIQSTCLKSNGQLNIDHKKPACVLYVKF